MGFLLPYWIIRWESSLSNRMVLTTSTGQCVIGLAVGAAGLILLIFTIQMFIRIGNGTIMPWDPIRKLIVVSLYAHVRNPMILSVLILQLGVAMLFASYGVLILAACYFRSLTAIIFPYTI